MFDNPIKSLILGPNPFLGGWRFIPCPGSVGLPMRGSMAPQWWAQKLRNGNDEGSG